MKQSCLNFLPPSLSQLADFGFSKEVDHDDFLDTYCGSPLYASPEMILGRPYFGSECDVWSLGVILYTMLTATMPFDDRDVPSFLSCVEKGLYPEPTGVSESEFITHTHTHTALTCSHTTAHWSFSSRVQKVCLERMFVLVVSTATNVEVE